jgi:hypothetical protein
MSTTHSHENWNHPGKFAERQRALRERDFGAAQRALADMPTDGCYDENIPFPNSWCLGLAARLRGDQGFARGLDVSAFVDSVRADHSFAAPCLWQTPSIRLRSSFSQFVALEEVHPAGLEPATFGSEGGLNRRSRQL